uniref:Atos homolog protein A n=1 Tax=Cyclopterus lumpus TaxID=8103 RepID=A0A8C3AMB3_CYCLU
MNSLPATFLQLVPCLDLKRSEFFEYDAEEFLVFLTLLMTEGRTPEYSVKGRTEGLHCPPAQSAMPPLHKHECSDKLPQCRQARRTRSEVILLWRNSIPIMIEVMLLPDCCYGDECPPSDPISDPIIKQDALLLERWTLQPIPRQSGDRFIEEKTLLLAVRSYVFFSQLSAWLSASHGIVPRNILYRISAADEELEWHFSQPPSEHVFPVPNVSQSVALQVRVQSLPRQPTYPTLACSIHTGLPPLYSKTPSLNPNLNSHGGLPTHKKSQDPSKDDLLHNSNMYSKSSNSILPHTAVPSPYNKKSQEPGEDHTYQNGELPQVNIPQRQGSPLFHRSSHSPTPSRSHSPSPLPTSKAGKWLYSALNGSSDPTPVEDYGSGSDRSKGSIPEPLRAFKNFSLAEPPRCPSPRPANETNPLIGSLLQERQEVIARIAQRLNFCDPTAPPLPPGLFASDNPPKAMWGTNHDDITASKTKEPEVPPYESVGQHDLMNADNFSLHANCNHLPPISVLQRAHSPSPLHPCNSWKKQNRHSLDATVTKAFHPCTGLPLLSSPVPQRKNQTGYFDLDTSLAGCKGLPWAYGKRVCPKREGYTDESQQLFSVSAPPASLSLLGNFEECVLNYRLEPLGLVEGFTAEVGASGSFCPSHLTLPVEVSFYSVSDDNAPSPYMGVINLESLGKRGYRVPPSGTIQVTLFNPNKTVVKMFVVMYDLRAMPAGHQTFLRQRTFSVPVRRDAINQTSRKPLGLGRTLRYLINLRFQSSKSGKIYLHRDIRLLFSRKSMEVDSGAAYELQSSTESPIDPPFAPRC